MTVVSFLSIFVETPRIKIGSVQNGIGVPAVPTNVTAVVVDERSKPPITPSDRILTADSATPKSANVIAGQRSSPSSRTTDFMFSLKQPLIPALNGMSGDNTQMPSLSDAPQQTSMILTDALQATTGLLGGQQFPNVNLLARPMPPTNLAAVVH